MSPPGLSQRLSRSLPLIVAGFAFAILASILLAQLSWGGEGASTAKALGSGDVRSALFLSLWTSTVAASLALLLALPTAWVLARRSFRGKALLDALVDVPIVLSPVVIGIALVLVFRSSAGQWFETHILPVIFEPAGIIAAQLVLALAIEIHILKTAFEALDPRYEEAARTLNTTSANTFVRVVLPMCRPGLIAAFALGWGRAIGDFGATVMIVGLVRHKTETLPIAIYNNLGSVRIGEALALALILTLIAFVVLFAVRALGRPRARR